MSGQLEINLPVKGVCMYERGACVWQELITTIQSASAERSNYTCAERLCYININCAAGGRRQGVIH